MLLEISLKTVLNITKPLEKIVQQAPRTLMKDSESIHAEIWGEGLTCSRDGDQLDAAGPTTDTAPSRASYEDLPGHLPADAAFGNFTFSAPS